MGNRCYISLPISDVPKDQLHATRDWAVTQIKSLGWDYFDPVSADARAEADCLDYREIILRDLSELRNCDRIWMCTGWEKSLGCLIEITAFISAWRKHKIDSCSRRTNLICAHYGDPSARLKGTEEQPVRMILVDSPVRRAVGDFQLVIDDAWAAMLERKAQTIAITPDPTPASESLFPQVTAPEKRRY